MAFMLKFYSALARLPRVAALREAQLACLSGTLDRRRTAAGALVDTRGPTCWAGFNLYGDPGWLRL
jgi:CHAT domain-containing protein